jgi:hypothetical protein
MEINGNNIMPKNASVFFCQKCDFKCSKESNWNTHINTLKHNRNYMEVIIMPKNAISCQTHICSHCDKKFKSLSGLWKHKKKCSMNQKTESTNIIINEPTQLDKIDMTQKLVELIIKNL